MALGRSRASALAVLTDKIDGDLARSRNLVTDFGKIADPIADKAADRGAPGLVMLSLARRNPPWWVTVVILARELGGHRRLVPPRSCTGSMPASRGGKLKTVAVSAWICC